MNLPERSPQPPEMRASDADRDQVAQVLREAAGEGRLTLDELDERLTAVYTAKTYAELEPVTRDLPTTGAPRQPPAFGAPISDAPSWKRGFAFCSEFKRQGVWNVPEKFTGFAFWGGGKVDLREARFTPGQEVRIRAFAIMGGIDVIVPDDLTVHVKGLGVMGAFDPTASGPGVPGAPRVVVQGLAFWGGVNVKRKKRKTKD
ncbi:DUF1707 domain-containing protein [Spirillospora sp. NPDC047279]|uniref:DUF1707 SHOCT-like domain-containing protein n=1 Tax=Spirillospora sp. NPDC047279 TaxID=3155478 RepID=UPI0033F3D72D